MPQARRRVHYSGRVQGVGFRFTSRDLARRFAIAGYVRNLDDGRVELVAEGEAAEVDGFLEAIRQAFGGKIHGTQVEDQPPGDPPFQGFLIRY